MPSLCVRDCVHVCALINPVSHCCHQSTPTALHSSIRPAPFGQYLTGHC